MDTPTIVTDGLPEADMYKLVVGNAAQLYELN